MPYANDEERKERTMKAALELVEYICSQRMVLAALEPDDALCRLGAETVGIEPDTARAIYMTMVEAQR